MHSACQGVLAVLPGTVSAMFAERGARARSTCICVLSDGSSAHRRTAHFATWQVCMLGTAVRMDLARVPLAHDMTTRVMVPSRACSYSCMHLPG